MENELSIYVSAASEMDAECELLGRLLAAMTKSTRWTIKRTPGIHEFANPDLESLAASDFYLILMGTDITAPIGVELRAAQHASLPLFAYRCSEGIATPAAAFFVHNVGVAWKSYASPKGFVRDFERRLIARLVEGTPGYGLNLDEIQDLSRRLDALRAQGDEDPATDGRRGAGGGGVILAADERI